MKTIKRILSCLIILLLLTACNQPKVTANYEVIPLPQSIRLSADEKAFVLSDKTQIIYPVGNELQKRNAEFLAEYIRLITGLQLPVTDQMAVNNAIVLKNEYMNENKEAYSLTINNKEIVINGNSEAGTFYGIQTLRKSIPADAQGAVAFPAAEINDYPRFGYRGMHLDVARHTFPLEFIKTYIDILALHNVNRFHWHISDDQGWRIEIKKYPELTEIASMRSETVIGKNTGRYDATPYGGFFTQDEAREVVRYAAERYITVIPEIDLPGHMLAALTCYPHLGCTGGPYEVEKTWGVFDDVLCAGNEDIYPFLEGVFEEIIDIFPSEYIHVGGDECPKTRWEKCPKCQAKIKELGIKGDAEHPAEFKLQSYVISRIEKYINSKGRQIIGWDEILEGGLAPNATVMSWQGMEGGIAAAKQHHDVIMVPTSYCYFDYYQSLDVANEPFGIGGYVPVEKVYSLEPMPAELTEDEQQYIIGAQANLWSEYILSPEHAEYMLLPRLAALSEVQWTMPEKKDYNAFLPRLAHLMKHYKILGYNYAKHVLDVRSEISVDKENRALVVTMRTFDDAPIHYTLDGTEPSTKSLRYEKPLQITATTQLRAVAIRDGERTREYKEDFNFNKASLKEITVETPTHRSYTYDGPITLVDAQRGGSSHTGGDWLGYYNADFVATIDLGEAMDVSSVTVGTLHSTSSWIFGASDYIVSLSEDGEHFHQVYYENYPVLPADSPNYETADLTATFDTEQARYVKVVAKVTPRIPDWHYGRGSATFVFVDEIIVE